MEDKMRNVGKFFFTVREKNVFTDAILVVLIGAIAFYSLYKQGFDTLKEIDLLTREWKQEDNTLRLYESVGYMMPAASNL